MMVISMFADGPDNDIENGHHNIKKVHTEYNEQQIWLKDQSD